MGRDSLSAMCERQEQQQAEPALQFAQQHRARRPLDARQKVES
jgi:hypothetical protein